MKLSTNDCRKYIADWVAQNSDQVPVDDYFVQSRARGNTDVSDGANPKDWMRLAKKKIGNVEYRLFQAGLSIIQGTHVFLLAEENGQLTHSHGNMRVFQNHPAVGPWIRHYLRIKE